MNDKRYEIKFITEMKQFGDMSKEELESISVSSIVDSVTKDDEWLRIFGKDNIVTCDEWSTY